MIFLTAQDFNQIPYNIPDAQVVDSEGNIAANTQLENYINDKVADILIKLLGSSLYDSFIEGLEALPAAWSATVPSGGYSIDDEVLYNNYVWKSLVDDNLNVTPVEGVNWTKVDNEWLMLRDGARYSKGYNWAGIKKMLIPYIYSLWLRDTYDDHTRVGIVTRTAENAIVISPAKRISRAYNEFSKMAGNFFLQRDTLYGYVIYANAIWSHYTDLYDTVNYDSFGRYMRNSFKNPGNMNFMNI